MQFLNLSECAEISRVCKFWNYCFNKIWFNYDYFNNFNFSKFNNPNQVNKIFEKSKLIHIKKMKSIMKGKKIDNFMKRTRLNTTIAKNMKANGRVFESFSAEPYKKSFAPFLIDKDIFTVCESSTFSLQFITLISCNLLTNDSFLMISRCKYLQNLVIKKN